MLSIFIKGFLISFSLIVAIGVQNAFVLKQALKKEYIFYIVIICVLIDIILISLGVLGLGYIIEQNQFFLKLITIFGIIFLSIYGFISLYSSYKGKYLQEDKNHKTKSLKQTIILLLIISLLNPHVYLDTVLLIGSIGGAYTSLNDKLIFLLGAFLASFTWFFLLGYATRYLIPLFKKKITWRILDLFIAVVMFTLAYSLLKYLI